MNFVFLKHCFKNNFYKSVFNKLLKKQKILTNVSIFLY